MFNILKHKHKGLCMYDTELWRYVLDPYLFLILEDCNHIFTLDISKSSCLKDVSAYIVQKFTQHYIVISFKNLAIFKIIVAPSKKKPTTTIKNKQKQGKNANWEKKNYELQFDSVNIQKRPNAWSPIYSQTLTK